MSKDDTTKFKGVGRLESAFGQSSINGIAGVVAAAVEGFTLRATPLNNSEAGRLAIAGVQLATIAIPPLVGLAQGWQKQDAAIKEHDHMIKENATLNTAISNAVHEGLINVNREVKLSRAS